MIRTGSESMLDFDVTLVNLLCSNRIDCWINCFGIYLFLLDLTLTLNVMRRNRSKIVALLLNNDNCKTIEYTYRPLHITLKHLVHTREEFYLLLFFSLLFLVRNSQSDSLLVLPTLLANCVCMSQAFCWKMLKVGLLKIMPDKRKTFSSELMHL